MALVGKWEGDTPVVVGCRFCGGEIKHVAAASVAPPVTKEAALAEYGRACVRDVLLTWCWCGTTEKGRVDIG